MKILHSRDDAQDVAQEIMLKVLIKKKILNFRGQSQLWSWLYRITLNACRSHWARKKRLSERYFLTWECIRERGVGRQTDPENLLVEAERRELFEKALAQLAPAYREGIREIYLNDRSYQECSRELEISVSRLGVRMLRAKKIMAQWIHQELRRRQTNAAKIRNTQTALVPQAA